MTLYDMFMSVAMVILFVIAACRLNDLKKDRVALRWWVRRFGFLLVMVGTGGWIMAHFTTFSPHWYSIVKVCIVWGMALAWMTTPQQPPLWNYISRNDLPPEAEAAINGNVP